MGTVFKAVHNTGNNDGSDGKGFSGATVKTFSTWSNPAMTDTIRYADGKSTYRTTNEFHTWGDSQSGYTPHAAANLLKWFKQVDADFKPGAIRVTHIRLYFFKGVTTLLNYALGDYLKTGPWKRLLFWSHSNQRSG